MAKYIALNTDGTLLETAASTTSSGSGSGGNIVALNASGQIDSTMLPGTNSTTATASENISAGALVNLWSNAGVQSVRNADNSSTAKRAHGYAPSAITSAGTGTIVLREGLNAGVTGLTVGAEYYLGTVGGVTTTIPTASGTIVQNVGVAMSSTSLSFVSHLPVTRA